MMKPLFFTILALFLATNVYTAVRVCQIAPANWLLRLFIISVFVLGVGGVALIFRFGESMSISLVGFLYKFGTSWMIVFLYIFLLVLSIDIFRLVNHFAHFVDKETMQNIFHHNALTSIIGFGLVAIILFLGNLQYHNKKRVELTIKTDKIERPMKIVAVSDLHLGYTSSKKEVAKWIELINAEKPDMVLIAGDLVDNQLRPVLHKSFEKDIQKIIAPQGIYACVGNHEYISGVKESIDFFDKSGIVLLRDSAAQTENIAIIGRDDYSNRLRKPLSELKNGIDREKFTILLDHQPHNLHEAQQAEVDFQFSGHTHSGQVFPISLITKRLFELAHGYKKKGDTHYYVSSGLGIWGGKFRIGTQSEYLVLNITN